MAKYHKDKEFCREPPEQVRECERIQVFHKCINGINWSCNSGNTLIILPFFFEDNIRYMLDKTVRVLYLLFRVCSEFQRGAMYSSLALHRPPAPTPPRKMCVAFITVPCGWCVVNGIPIYLGWRA